MGKKRPITGGMRVRAYPVLERAIEEGFQYGWHRAHKHVENPSSAAIEEAVTQAILSAICEVFDFDEDKE
jgi:hypothetical protein